MNITKNFVKMKQPCVSGMRWFLRHQEQGSDYQPLLDALVELHRFMLSYIAAMNFRFGSVPALRNSPRIFRLVDLICSAEQQGSAKTGHLAHRPN
jgi:hypothetical protein